jgi:hypothetical protein
MNGISSSNAPGPNAGSGAGAIGALGSAVTATIVNRCIDHPSRMNACRCQAQPFLQRQAQAIELCQNLEQLHPFPDANARTFSILLLNHLLARDKLPLAMFEDPNRLDGWSKAELSQVLEQGQARVAQWSGQHAPKAIKPSKSGLNPLSNLRKLFKKT